MILSFRHKFLFVRPMKVAGTSVEMVLSTICGNTDIVSPLIAIDERERQAMGGFCGNYSASRDAELLYNRLVSTADTEKLHKLPHPPAIFSNHMSVAAIVEASAIDLAEFRLIGIKRNPYARLISFLHMNRHFKSYKRGDAMPEGGEPLDAAMDRAIKLGTMAAMRSRDLYGDAVPELLRYEHLAEDVAALAASLGVTLPPLPHSKRGAMANAIDPLSVLRRDQIDWFNAYCAEEFEPLGYEMV